jgi:Domain of unknown function (DUF4112)
MESKRMNLSRREARKLETLLDEAFTIPGTSIRFGLNAIVDLVSGIGDALAGFAACRASRWCERRPTLALACLWCRCRS